MRIERVCGRAATLWLPCPFTRLFLPRLPSTRMAILYGARQRHRFCAPYPPLKRSASVPHMASVDCHCCCAKASVGNRAFSLRYACTHQKVSSLHARVSQQPKGAFNLLFAATRSQLHATLHSHTSVLIITRSITPSQINMAFAGRGHHVRGSPMLAIDATATVSAEWPGFLCQTTPSVHLERASILFFSISNMHTDKAAALERS